MNAPRRLEPPQLRWRVDPAQFSFQTTDELAELTEAIGQPRAVEAIRFGISIRHDGYNLFVVGEPGTGRHTLVQQHLGESAAKQPAPHEWCYVNNFEEPHKPRALKLPAGLGVRLRHDMGRLVAELKGAIPAAFESEEYRARRQEIEEQLKEHHEAAFEELRKTAESHGVTLIRTPSGMAFAPTRDGDVLSPADFEKLPAEEKKRVEEVVAVLQEQLERIIRQIPQWKRESQERIQELDRQVVMAAVGHLIEEFKRTYAEHAEVVAYFDAVEKSVIENAEDFRRTEEGPEITFLGVPIGRAARGVSSLRRFEVNVLIDHSATQGAPVVYEDNPTHGALIGRIEHVAQMGALVTDFMLIKPGALHRANGGYLVLDARKVLLQPFAWEGLKRALSAGRLRIESIGQALSLVSTVSLEPEAIPLDVKVVLIGERILYYLLQALDPEFQNLFKVMADFDDSMPRIESDHDLYARLIGTLVKRESLLPFDREAVARVLEEGARMVEDTQRLSVRVGEVANLLREADHWGRAQGRERITRSDVQQAIDARVRRVDRVRERLFEEIQRGIVMIDTSGTRVGQVNGISVARLAEFSFGFPVRITARVRLGKGEVVDIQREVEMGGPIHAKGVLILSSFLGARYAPEHPMSLAASLVFEQTYGEVEGDSASCAELYALLSALAGVPIRQSLAVTGSVNQFGDVQPIGGVNDKIEGYFDICSERGLTGEQGVLIPETNVAHLMLREDVVEACGQGKFHIYPVRNIDEGLEVLTGMAAGERDESGLFPEDTVNRRVEERLVVFSELARLYAGVHEGGGEEA